ncbi:MAG: 30S ribosomal protein S8e [Candidatus ainarchaeum sp.]|nr:30S ribosomal protein S8e [Candidatus ainarchaeum sp.]MDD5096145.1 30S ribosomal protein S8e [Candidatus ainarchaeum sp.]
MVYQYHEPSRKKVSGGTGGRKRKARDRKLAHIGGGFTATKVSGKEDRYPKRGRGGNIKVKARHTGFVNVLMDGKTKRAKILSVIESHNPQYARQNIITKGAVLNTDAGKVRVTNRVGQDGVVNGILVK